jgi:hypothetical protein
MNNMIKNKAHFDVTNMLLGPVRHTGGKMINHPNVAQIVLYSYKELLDSYITAVLTGLPADLPASYVNQIKTSLYRQGMGVYIECLAMSGSTNPVAPLVAKLIESEENFKTVESKTEFGNYRQMFSHVYESLVAAIEGMKKNFRPLDDIRFIPSYAPAHYLTAVSELTNVDSLMSTLDEMGLSASELKAAEKKKKEMVGVLKLVEEDLQKLSYKGALAMDLVEFVQRLDSNELVSDQRVSLAKDYAFGFSSASYPILPGCSLDNEDSLHGAKGDTASMVRYSSAESSGAGWIALTGRVDKAGNEEPAELGCPVRLKHIVAGLVHAWIVGQGIDKFHVTLPLTAAPIYPMLEDAYAHSYKDVTMSFDLQYFDVLVDVAKKSNNSKPWTYATYLSTLDSAVANDRLVVQHKAKEMVEKHVFGDVNATILRHLEKAGTKDSYYKILDGATAFQIPSSVVDRDSGHIEINSDRTFFHHRSVPTSTPVFSSDALLIKGRGDLEGTDYAVAGSDIINLMSEFYTWQGNEADGMIFDPSVSGIEDSLRRDMAVTLGNVQYPHPMGTHVTNVYDYSSADAYPNKFTVNDLCHIYGAPELPGHVQLWEEMPSQNKVSGLGYNNVMVSRDVRSVVMRSDVLSFGTYEGMFTPEIEKVRSNSIMEITRKLYKSYFFAQLPSKTDNVEYKRTFKDKPYHIRVRDFHDNFISFQISKQAYRLISHRLAAPFLGTTLNGNVLNDMAKGNIYVNTTVHSDMAQLASETARSLKVNMNEESLAFQSLKKFLNGDLTVSDHDILQREDVAGFFSILLSTVFKDIAGKDPLLFMVYTTILLNLFLNQKEDK